ncbi:MAG: Hpt domain-containing protein [Polyangiaceae bacterium]|jgi:two-component system chemotaxis sensor kinase CheA
MALTEKDLSRFEATFFEEAEEHVATMEQALLALETSPDDSELVNSVFRAAHSIKGGAGMFGFGALAEFTHALESLLDRLRQGRDRPTPRVADVLLRSADTLRGLLDAARLRGQEPTEVGAMRESLERELDAVGGKPNANGSSQARDRHAGPQEIRDVEVAFEPGCELFARGMDPLLVVRDLLSLGEAGRVRSDLSSLPDLDALDPEVWLPALRRRASHGGERLCDPRRVRLRRGREQDRHHAPSPRG